SQHHASLVAVVDAATDDDRSAVLQGASVAAVGLREDGQRDGAVHHVERGERHPVAALRGVLRERADLTKQEDARAYGSRSALTGRRGTQPSADVPVLLERMSRQVEAKDLLLIRQQLLYRPLRHIDRPGGTRSLHGPRRLAKRLEQ